MLVLSALGRSEIDTGKATVTPSQEIVFAAALYLALETGRPVSRSKLAGILWPSVTENSRAHRLRQTILQLKKIGVPIEADRTSLYIPEHVVQSDVARLSTQDSVSVSQLESIEFLPGYSPRYSEPLREWVDAKREETHASAIRVLLREVDRRRLKGDWASVERFAGKCLSLDPFNESAVLARAEACAMRGGKLKAVSILDRYLEDVGGGVPELKLPAAILRRRVVERLPDRPALPIKDPPFVGREIEMEALASGFERAKSGSGSCTLVIGEPGIGKSRLGAELARFAGLQGAQVLHARCRPTDIDRPLSLFVEVVPQLREMPGALGCAPETFLWLKRLTQFEGRADSVWRPADAEIPFQNVCEALFDLFDAVAAEKCLVLVVEDVQWLDSASAKILIQLIEWCATKRVFILANSRPSDGFLPQRAGGQVIQLIGLDDGACAALLESIVLDSASTLQTGFADWCLRVAEGNPFFLQELAHQWIETGRRYEAPPSVNKVLQERLSRLTQQALHVLQTSAVLGECATINRVERALGYRSHQILAAIEELSCAAMLRPIGSPDTEGGRIQPRHDFLATAALAPLAPTSLAFLHSRAADVLEEEMARTAASTTLLWASASHRNSAGDRERALSLGISCAQHLLDLGLSAEACTRFEDSLAYCSSKDDRLSLLPHYSVALQVNGEWERSKQVLQTCVALTSPQNGGNPHNHYEILLFQARHRSNLDFVTLLNDMMPCIECESASPAHRVGTAIIALKVASDVGPAGTLDAIYHHIKPFLASGEVDFVTRFEAELIYQTMRGEKEIPLTDVGQFLEIVRSTSGEIAYSHALALAASACRLSGRDEESLQFLNTALKHAESHKLRTRIPALLLAEIRLHVAAENFRSARDAINRGRLYPIPIDEGVTRPEWQFFEARVALEDRTLEEIETAVRVIEVLPENCAVGRLTACLSVVLRLRLMQGKDRDVLKPLVTRLEAAHAINRDIGMQDFEVHALFLGLCAIGEESKGRRLVHDYVRRFRRSRRRLTSPLARVFSEQGKDLDLPEGALCAIDLVG